MEKKKDWKNKRKEADASKKSTGMEVSSETESLTNQFEIEEKKTGSAKTNVCCSVWTNEWKLSTELSFQELTHFVLISKAPIFVVANSTQVVLP